MNKQKKEIKTPTNKELFTLSYYGIGLISFGLVFFWVPVLNIMLLGFGGLLLTSAVFAAIVKVLK